MTGQNFSVDPPAERRQDWVAEDLVEDGQDQAGNHAGRDGVADALMGTLLVFCAEADAHKGTAAVADHDGGRHAAAMSRPDNWG